MMIKIYIYKLTDCWGNICWDCVSDTSNNICLYGHYLDSKYHQYDSYEGYHAYKWAEAYGFKLELIERLIEI